MSDETLNPLGGRWVAADGTPLAPTYAAAKDRYIDELRSQNQALQERATEAEARVDELLQDVADLQAKLFEAYAKKRKWKGHFDAAKRQLLSPTQETDPEMEKQFPDGDSESFR